MKTIELLIMESNDKTTYFSGYVGYRGENTFEGMIDNQKAKCKFDKKYTQSL